MKRAFQGIRILDFTRVLSGPFCTAMLADLGAEVIKVEGPGDASDILRFEDWGTINDEPIFFMAVNRGKKGIVLDLKTKKGKEIVTELAAISDVIVENFRPGVMERLGVGYSTVKEINPQIIYASLSGFGKGSPYEEMPAFDIVAQAMGGLMSVTGEENGPPMRVGANVGDTFASLYAAFAIATALWVRETRGIGQRIEISMCDAIFSILDVALYKYLATGDVPTRIGSADHTVYPFDLFSASDGFFVLAAYDPRTYPRFCEAIGRPDLVEAQEFATVDQRWTNRAKMKKIIENWSSRRTVDEVLEIMGEAGVPAAPVLNIQDIAESDHIDARNILIDIEHPKAGKTRIPIIPVKFSETPACIERPSPQLGQHTDEVLGDLLGMTEEEIGQLRRKKII